jgi:pimeloyl-ACP methyl ester carboxylesterase
MVGDVIRSPQVTGVFSLLDLFALSLFALLSVVAAFLIYLVIRYGRFITRIFEEQPLFMPLRIIPTDLGEPVTFQTEDGVVLAGSYFHRRSDERAGLLVFCHEFLSDRFSYYPYLDHLRDQGYDLFAFDFRNHGTSATDSSYTPLQWATDHEVSDLSAALDYLRARQDHDPAGFGLFGVSRGGCTALLVAAQAPDVWGVVTDGAFPTRGTMTAYILRWAEIYVTSALFLAWAPVWVYKFLCWVSRLQSERRLNCRFPDIETAASRLSPRPWLMIHGQKDAYIGPDIARALFEHGREPKEMWLVSGAKHNRCRECQPEAYADRVTSFLHRFGPRQPIESAVAEAPAGHHEFAAKAGFSLEPVNLLTKATASASS